MRVLGNVLGSDLRLGQRTCWPFVTFVATTTFSLRFPARLSDEEAGPRVAAPLRRAPRADGCAIVRTVDEQLVREAGASECASSSCEPRSCSTHYERLARDAELHEDHRLRGRRHREELARQQLEQKRVVASGTACVHLARVRGAHQSPHMLFCDSDTDRLVRRGDSGGSTSSRQWRARAANAAGNVPGPGVPSLMAIAPHATLHLVNLSLINGVAATAARSRSRLRRARVRARLFHRNGAILGGACTWVRARGPDCSSALERNVAAWYGGVCGYR